MIKQIVLAALIGVSVANNGPIIDCGPDSTGKFIADIEDLCRFHWCMDGGNHTIEMQCAPGSRVPSWWVSSADHVVPCTQPSYDEVHCCRCELPADERKPEDDDDCVDHKCANGCSCQDLYQMYHCLCPDDIGYVPVSVDATVNQCEEDNCVNGATCHSQWDDYWCECPPGFTGKHCEVSFCNPNPCKNGGTCSIDEISYFCDCPPGFTGYCCDGTERPPQTIAPTTTQKPTTAAPEVECDSCHYGAGCEQLKLDLCQCNECPNYDDRCTDGTVDQERTCVSNPDLSGTPFSLLFMQNRPDDTESRTLDCYVTAAGSQTREVRAYSPYVSKDSNCYFEENFTVAGFSVKRFTIPRPQCYEMQDSRIFDDKMIKIEAVDNGDLLIYCVNTDTFSADAWIAYPDSQASQNFYVVAYGPAVYATQFAVLALEDNTKVTISYPSGVTPNIQGSEFTLKAGQSMQIQSADDLTGTKIEASKPIHAYSGNIRALITEVIDPTRPDITSGSRDHLIEQLIPHRAWGYEYHVVPVPDRVFGDQLRIVASEDATTVVVSSSDGGKKTFKLQAGGFAIDDAYSGNMYQISSDKKILVSQITKSKDREEGSNDPSLILLPAVQQFSNRFLFSTPEYSGGSTGISKPYNTSFVLISAKAEDRDGIYVRNTRTGMFKVTDQTQYGNWEQIPGTNYYGKAVRIDYGTNFIQHDDQDAAFMCLFYGMDDRESLGFPVGMMMRTIS